MGVPGGSSSYQSYGSGYDGVMMESAPASMGMTASKSYISPGGDDFSPDTIERKITKTASLYTTVKSGKFDAAASKVKDILSSADFILLDEDVDKHDTERGSYYYTANYRIKVAVDDYENVIAKLKEIGTVDSFNENQRDITEQYENVQLELKTEKARLVRYKEMYSEAEELEDKINLNDRIFNQERTIEYLEDRISNLKNKVNYSTINLRLSEEKSDYADVVFIKVKDLVFAFTMSLNALVAFVVWILPWAVALLIVRWGWKKFKG